MLVERERETEMWRVEGASSTKSFALDMDSCERSHVRKCVDQFVVAVVVVVVVVVIVAHIVAVVVERASAQSSLNGLTLDDFCPRSDTHMHMHTFTHTHTQRVSALCPEFQRAMTSLSFSPIRHTPHTTQPTQRKTHRFQRSRRRRSLYLSCVAALRRSAASAALCTQNTTTLLMGG